MPMNWHPHTSIRSTMNRFRHPGRFAPAQEYVIRAESERSICQVRLRREYHQAPFFVAPPRIERSERHVIHERYVVDVVEPGAAEAALGRGERCGPDDMHRYAEAGAEPQDGPRVLRNVRFIKGDRQRHFFSTARRVPGA